MKGHDMNKLLVLILLSLPAFALEESGGICSDSTSDGRLVEWACTDITPVPEPEPEPPPQPDPAPDFTGCNPYEGGYVCVVRRTINSDWAEYTISYSSATYWGYWPVGTCPPATPGATITPECGATPPPDPDPTPEPPPPPSQTSYRGIPDPSATLGYDVFANYPAQQTVTGPQGQRQLTCNGTAANPCLIDASGATFTTVAISGSYVILQGGTVNAPSSNGPFVATYQCTNCVIRDVTLTGPGIDNGHSSAVQLSNNSAWIRGSIAHFGNSSTSSREQDFHGIKIQANNVWVWEAEIYDVSGDSIQCGDATRGGCSNVYIAGGSYHSNRENAVDIKDSNNVVVSGVQMYGFSATQENGPNPAIVVHDDAYGSKFYDNDISQTIYGIVTSGVSGHEITGNTISASQIGIQCRNTQNVNISGNTISAPTRIDRQSNCNGIVQ